MLKRYRPLSTGRVSRAATEAAIRFVTDLWEDYDTSAYTFIGTRRGSRWRDHAIRGDRAEKAAAIIAAHAADRFDIYFCPNAFDGPQRRSALALPSRYAWCDIDDADPDAYDPQPSILWETSPNRFQGLWLCRKTSPASIAQQISRNIWEKDGGDKGGWSITKMLRLPGTINHKREYQKPVVTLRVFDERPIKIPRGLRKVSEQPLGISAHPISIDGLDYPEIVRRYRRPMGLLAGSLMTSRSVRRHDRSGVVCLIISWLIRLGATDAEIAVVLVNNVYFVSKWGTDLDTAFDQIARIRVRSVVSR